MSNHKHPTKRPSKSSSKMKTKKNKKKKKNTKNTYDSYRSVAEKKKSKEYDKLEKRQHYGLTLKTKILLPLLLLILLICGTSIQSLFFAKKLDTFTSTLGDSFTVKTSLQHQWVFKGNVISTKKFAGTPINLVSYKGVPELVDSLLIENKARGTYLLTDDKDTVYLLGDTTYKLDKKFISTLLNFKESSEYTLKNLLESNKDYVIIAYTIVTFVLLSLKSLAIILFTAFFMYIYSKMRYKELYFIGIFYATLHNYLYAYLFSTLFNLFIKSPIDFSIILTVILTVLYVEYGKRIIPTSKISLNPFILFFKGKKDATTIQKLDEEQSENILHEEQQEEQLQEKEEHRVTDSTNPTDSIDTELTTTKNNIEKLQKEAHLFEQQMKQEFDVDVYDENTDFAVAYAAYQNREKQKEIDALDDINIIINALHTKDTDKDKDTKL